MKTVWEKYDAKQMKAVMAFSEDYKDFLDHAKTEREAVSKSIELAEKAGFKEFRNVKKIKAGDKFYFNNRGKSLALFVIGKKPIEEGMNILGAHIDSPRIDVKQNPLYEDNGLVLMDTHYYGGIKKYQWTARPLAIHGVVCKKDGTKIDICIGEKESDPIVEISDLLIHLAKDQMSKPGSNVVEGEDLNALAGSIPAKSKKEEKDPVKKNLLDILKKDYDMEEADFISAELELVPCGKARDLGLDRSMIMGYGHDDRICAYTSLAALLESDKPERTSVCILTDKEEIGSIGSTGAQSAFFENSVAELINVQGEYNDLKIRHALENSRMLSSDVSAAYDPNYPQVNEAKNAAYFGKGISFNKYTGSRGKSGSNDAPAEFIAKIRKIMDENDVAFQFSELGRVDQGGGGTIAYVLANKNMDVVDAGIAVQNMHAPYETASKADIYEAYRAYKVFLKEMD
ncbi:MAG: aminopeptidase [Erysipelotrichaceae bacterium]|nr:aminopeptidase [Erysipelotrichaceae bacterium]MBR6232695.1 aminopeptidase [Erysipelotrichaceae bacterium]